MNSRYVWSTSVFVFLVAVTFAYQNCTKKEFAQTSQSVIATGSKINSIDENGNTDGEVIIKSCQADPSTCPEFVKIRFYAFDASNKKERIGEVLADKVLNDKGEVVYKFSFVVPKQYACFKIKAYLVDPKTEVEIEIPYSAGSQTKAFEEKCDDDPDEPPGGSGDPLVDIQSVDVDGRLVQVNGKCAIGAPVGFSGDINSLIDKNEDCTTGVFKHCNLIDKYQNNNTIDGKQTLNSKQDSDSVVVKWSTQPIKVITYESFVVDADQKNITITGYCNPTDTVKLSAYGGATNASTVCTAGGTYSVKAPILVPSLLNKGREVAGFGENSVAVGGNTPIIAYDPDKNVQPVCAISTTVANATMCSKQAGVVSGTCTKGLPVHVSVNGQSQNIGYCSNSGTFSIKNVLLSEAGSSNTITIEQKNPYGKKCSASKNLMNF